MLDFYKYEGAGNDFILVDDRIGSFPSKDQDLVKRLCGRKFGVGADGLMLLRSCPGYDFEMVYYNADGRESTMCGNGGRCLTAFARLLGMIETKTRFFAIDGEHEAFIMNESGNLTQIKLKMKDVMVEEPVGGNFFIDTGSPHYVIFGTNVNRMDVVKKAAASGTIVIHASSTR